MYEHNPGGCECLVCGAIFIGQPADTACDSCTKEMRLQEAENAMRSEWHREMREDAFGEKGLK